MAQHPVQIHIVVSTDKRMATRAYCRDEHGWYCQQSATNHCDGSPLSDGDHDLELMLEDSQEAVADAMLALHAAFAAMLAPGEKLPELVQMPVKEGSTLN